MASEQDASFAEAVKKPTAMKDLCRTCQLYGLSLFQSLPKGDYFYGTYDMLKERNSCPLCTVILYILEKNEAGIDFSQQRHRDNLFFHLRPLTDEVGRSVDIMCYPHARIHEMNLGSLRTGDINIPDMILDEQFLYISQNAAYCRAIQKSISDGSYVPMEFIQGALQECKGKHGDNCNIKYSNARYQEPIPLLLIDAVENCLVSATSAEIYLTLSYVWGNFPQLETTNETVSALSKPGALIAEQKRIPKTILDALALTKALKHRYLWVDALCIIQNNLDSKRDNISRMDTIYVQSLLTIVAASGVDANAGLPGVEQNSRPKRERSLVGNVEVLLPPTSFSQALLGSKYNTRGWTFQERILSRRCLIFTHDQVFFQCNSAIRSEVDVPHPGRYYSRGLSAWSPDRIEGIPVNTLRPLAVFEAANPFSDLWAMSGPHLEWNKGWKAYAELVENYSQRNLSYRSDYHSAFAGILRSLDECYGGGFVSGIPAAELDAALLWTAHENNEELREVKSLRDVNFPSWSWLSCWGPVAYGRLAWQQHNYSFQEVLISKIKEFRVGETTVNRKIVRRIDNKQVDSAASQPDTEPTAVKPSNLTERFEDQNRGSGVRLSRITKALKRLISPPPKKEPQQNNTKSEPYYEKPELEPSREDPDSNLKWQKCLFFRAQTSKLQHLRLKNSSDGLESLAWLIDANSHQCGTVHGPGLDEEIEISEFVLMSQMERCSSKTCDCRGDYSKPFSGDYLQGKVLNVLAIKWHGDFAERVAVGQISSYAWDPEELAVIGDPLAFCKPVEKLIQLI